MNGRRIFQWTDERGKHSMFRPEQLEQCGWRRVARSPRYPSTILMERMW